MILAAGALATLEIIDELSPVGFTKSYSVNRRRSFQDRNQKEMQKFYNTLNYLKAQGFIGKKKSENRMLWKITSSGLKKLQLLQQRAFSNYDVIKDNKLKIIVFDIPEKERQKRGWLREILRGLGFRMLQQSVWIGKNKIPEQFLYDLRQKHLLPYIHVMEIGKSGTMRELT